jgi:DNA-binding transcriptional regulator YdaS (Cro superfamily)
MPKSSTNNYMPKPPELVAAEEAGRMALRTYCRAEPGRAANIARYTGLLPAVLSRMANKDTHINLEAAVMIDVATDGAVRAEVLCPGRAELLGQFLRMREVAQEA